MKNILYPIRVKLQTKYCPVHHKHPQVSIIGSRLNIQCCCEEFRSQLVELSSDLVQKEATSSIEQIIRKHIK